MECCEIPAKREERVADRTACPRCGRPGKRLDEVTLKSLLTRTALARRSEERHRFCATARCPVVYFGSEEIFESEDVSVPVFQKARDERTPVCYCFGITAADVRREVQATGSSTVEQRVRGLVRGGRCACELRNPQGTCCLGNLAKVVRAACEALAPGAGGAAKP